MSSARYRPRPWRSRFLRAPALALQLAKREDFVALGSVAEVSLGLKTGADGFFFLKAGSPQKVGELGRPRSRSSIQVKGASWEGQLSKGDLRGALLNPHRLQGKRGRAFVVPSRTEDLYLSPQDRPPRVGLADYIAVGTRKGLPSQPLVKANGRKNRWDRQARAPIDWRWVLPYNSAYDYGAQDNAAGLVLNGRFVGCRAREEIDEELLGAALNSTFVTVTRLLEGTSTGSEGAYDVGPPAARLTQIPDPRRLEPRREEILAVMDEWREEDLIPAAPDRSGEVPELRRRLDTLILIAAGESKGEAAYQLDQCYSSYARWRSAVEDVEARVRVNRRALSGSGRQRSDDPIDRVASQIWDELSLELPLLPSARLAGDAETDAVSVAGTYRAPEHEPMFEAGVLQSPNGESVDLGSFARVRLADRLLRIGFRAPLLIPKDAELAGEIADLYDETLKGLEQRARALATAQIGSEQAAEVTEAVVRLWRHASHAAGGGDQHPE